MARKLQGLIKPRKLVQHFRYCEDNMRRLLQIATRMDMITQIHQLDDRSSALVSTVRMFETASFGEPTILEYITQYTSPCELTESDFNLAREVIGVLRPLAENYNASQACSATGS